ncbi:hypothetical protein VHEMI05442 [[Torrubiella] hemipterigena]|uniref:AB hydrolase-1 domain-containing protein n=1 Tax=[Torrubiella] hemipterigena TaxID=1531966 RepID=A0A0A1TIS4_9HYPO|nr:hypothetical protein VHEMI05442 [[Torrubiella] hemipterigena]
MDNRSAFKSSRGVQYSYEYKPAKSKSTLLFLHGFPSHLGEWANQVNHFAALGYGTIAVDMLGFGHSSKPDDGSELTFKSMAADLIELLDALTVSKVIGIGHDLGANFLGKLAAFYPSRFIELVFLSVGSGVPGQEFNIDMIHKMTKQFLGHEMFGYISWLAASPNPHQTLEKHAASAMSLLYTSEPSTWNQHFHPLGNFEAFVSADETVPIGAWYTADMQKQHLALYGAKDGYKGATRWYQMMVENLSLAGEKEIEGSELSMPSLFVGHGEQDPLSGQQIQMLQPWVPNLQVKHIPSGHWVHLEKPEETNKILEEFFTTL